MLSMENKKGVGRRNFLKTAALGAAGMSIGPAVHVATATTSGPTSPSTLNKWPGRVVINFNKAAVTGTSTAVPAVIAKMVDDSIKKLTDETTVGAAWKAVFPSTLSATSKIAIKICTLNSGKPAPHWSSVKAITDALVQMDVGGAKFPAANITIYEMAGSMSAAGYNATNLPGITIVTDSAVDGTDGALSNRKYAKTLKDAAFLINVFSPRGHSFPPAGSKFTLGFKSHYGTYENPMGMHGNPMGADIPKNAREINCIGPVYNKLVMSMCSGIFGMNEGNGPTGNADIFTTYAQTMDKTSTTQCPTTIMLSTDPVSIEMQSIKMLRINKGGKYTPADMPDYLKASGGMDASGLTPTYNIGTIDESKMDIRIINAATAINIPAAKGFRQEAGLSAHPIHGSNVFIEFRLPAESVDKLATLEIVDARGSIVKQFQQKVLGTNNHLSWDLKNSRGSSVSHGAYFVRLACGNTNLSAHFSTMQ
jgi:hypothetical protein